MNAAPPHDVAIILVGLNACNYIRQCVESITRAPWERHTYEIIYVDNGSTDGTLAMLREQFPGVRVHANPTNLGFCKAANQGAALAASRLYFFLNDDTIVLEDAIPKLIDLLDADPAVGVAGSRLLFPDLSEQWSGRRFPSPLNGILGRRSWLSRFFPNARALSDYLCKEQLQGGVPFEVDWVSAAALMVRPEVFRSIGGFAEDYYYWHEPVFCDRIRRLGLRIFLHPASRIIHYEGKGSGKRPHRVRRFHIINFHQGAYRCYCEHYGLGRLHPLRWLVGAALGTRSLLLLSGSWLQSLREESR